MAKRYEIGPRLLLITNRKSHIVFQMIRKSLILDDLERQYCNRNCIGCSASSIATVRFYRLHLTNVANTSFYSWS